MKPVLRLGAAMLALTLGGCATVAPLPDEAQTVQRWNQHRTNLAQIHSFDLQARLAGNAVGVKADVNWHQAADGSFRIRASGPFGAGGVSLRGTLTSVEVTTAEGSFTTAEPERWLSEQLGWTLPLGALRWWALGLPAPHSEAQLELDGDGHAVSLRQDGWQLAYEAYAPVDGQVLPRRLRAESSTARLILLADQWQPNPAP